MAARKHRVIPFEVKIVSGSIGSVLSSLIRKVMHENGMDTRSYNNLMHWYVLKEQQRSNRNDRNAARMGLSQELLKEAMTWKTFIKGIEFLNVVKFDLDVKATFEDGHVRRPVERVVTAEIGEPGEILARLYHQLAELEGSTPEVHQKRLHAYIEKTRGLQSSKDKASARASLSKELQKDVMTWKTFVKGLVFLGVTKFSFCIVVHHRNIGKSAHIVNVNLDDFNEETEDE